MATVLLASAPADASTPSLLWRGVDRVGIVCLAQPGTVAGIRQFETAICERVRLLASRRSPHAVTIVQPGDRALVAANTVTLLVHASMQPTAAGGLVAFSVRPMRASIDPNEVLFGSAPRAAISSARAISPSLNSALVSALSETLPWLAGPERPRRLSRRR